MIRRAAISLRLRAADAVDSLAGRRDHLTPPRRMSGYVGRGDFRATGEEFLGHFRELGGLRAEDRVLEIGCGIGRMARVLAGVLRPPGSYDGFDIVASGIAWCQEHYRGTAAPFRFVHADLRNTAYNPAGALPAEAYRFPYGDGAFDLVIATSLFTHLLPAAAEHYLAEAARVLAPGGRLLSTWLLFSAGRPAARGVRAADRRGPRGRGRPIRRSPRPPSPTTRAGSPSGWTARGLSRHALAHGTWSGLEGRSLQDIVVAHRH